MSDLIAERMATHGDWPVTAAIARQLKTLVAEEWCRRSARGQSAPTAGQIEALDLICTKIARILAGNPAHVDHWRDIHGYLELIDRATAPMRFATDEELQAQRESWARGEMAIGLDRREAADRAAREADDPATGK